MKKKKKNPKGTLKVIILVCNFWVTNTIGDMFRQEMETKSQAVTMDKCCSIFWSVLLSQLSFIDWEGWSSLKLSNISRYMDSDKPIISQEYVSTDILRPTWEGNFLRVSLPSLHFLLPSQLKLHPIDELKQSLSGNKEHTRFYFYICLFQRVEVSAKLPGVY